MYVHLMEIMKLHHRKKVILPKKERGVSLIHFNKYCLSTCIIDLILPYTDVFITRRNMFNMGDTLNIKHFSSINA